MHSVARLLKRRREDQRGNAILEFLMLLPMYFVLLVLLAEMILWYFGLPFVGSTIEMFADVRNEALESTHTSKDMVVRYKFEKRKYFAYLLMVNKSWEAMVRLAYVGER